MTTDERYARLRDLFEKAHSLPEGERDAFLDEATTSDGELAAEVASLLRAGGRRDDFLAQPTARFFGSEDALTGTSFGDYRVEELIATGGMGAVYRARQEHPSREVALKVIRPHAVTPHLLRRFELEAEALGRLDHPGIARIFAASTADTKHGRIPFFAMELVPGEPLTQYASRHGLDVDAKVGLLATIAEAVHHAHQNGIIHRDLKPANILVREDGQPKVLDFGVARVTDADVQATTLLTDSGLIVGTLAYMSPEQVRGRHDELDIRADIYALGVVGYQLLTGRLPLELAGKTVSAAALMIESQPPRPLSDTGGSFPSDLETIVATCLEKEKTRRYGSAAELAADLRRFLADEPIMARPPSVVYQLAKFARRNRALVSGAALGLAALIVGLAVSLAGWSAAAKARTRAETEAAKATLLNTYLTDILRAPDPWEDGKDVKVVELLARASQNLEDVLAGQPEVAAIAHQRLGFTYQDLGQYEDAESHFRRALEIGRGIPDFPLGNEIEMLMDLGYVRLAQGELDDAETILEDAFDRAENGLGADSPVRLKASHQVAILRWEQGDLETAESQFRQCLEESLTALGPEHEDTIVTTAALGNVLQQEGKLDAAQPLLERALEWDLEHYGEDHPSTAIVINNLAFVYQKLGQHERALEMFERSLATRRRVHVHDSMGVLVGLNNVGLQLGMMNRGEDALAFLEEAMGIAGRLFEPDHWRLAALRSTYGRTLLVAGRYEDAERELLLSLEGLRREVGEDHWRTKAVCQSLVTLYRQTGDTRNEARYLALAE